MDDLGESPVSFEEFKALMLSNRVSVNDIPGVGLACGGRGLALSKARMINLLGMRATQLQRSKSVFETLACMSSTHLTRTSLP